jgi:hypothetical protein
MSQHDVNHFIYMLPKQQLPSHTVLAAEKAIKRKIALHKKDEDLSDGEDEGGSSEDDAKWGVSKSQYYDAEDVDIDVRSADRHSSYFMSLPFTLIFICI